MNLTARVIWMLAAAVMIGTLAFAAGNVQEGKKLFNDPDLSGSTNERSCNTCHPNGKGLEGIAGKKEIKTPAGTSEKLEATINQCITMALKGKPLPPDSAEMQDLEAYIHSLQ